jgi:hypothetical protein
VGLVVAQAVNAFMVLTVARILGMDEVRVRFSVKAQPGGREFESLTSKQLQRRPFLVRRILKYTDKRCGGVSSVDKSAGKMGH